MTKLIYGYSTDNPILCILNKCWLLD